MTTTTLLDIDTVAAALHCTPETVREHIRQGRLRATKPVGRWLVREVDLETFITENLSAVPAQRNRRRRRRVA